MPLYSFHCSACDAQSELLMRSDETAICPACGSDKMERLPSWLAPDLKMEKIRKAGRARPPLRATFPISARRKRPRSRNDVILSRSSG